MFDFFGGLEKIFYLSQFSKFFEDNNNLLILTLKIVLDGDKVFFLMKIDYISKKIRNIFHYISQKVSSRISKGT